jgi:hypothetical protein
MKKTLLVLLGISLAFFAVAQTTQAVSSDAAASKNQKSKKEAETKVATPVAEKTKKQLLDLGNRPSDHLMIQWGADSWTNRPDSVRTGGFSRHFNVYFMFDKPFKTNQKLSLAYGIGIGSSNIFFNKTNVDVKSSSSKLPFTNVDSANHYNKFKVTTIYAEIPVELRYFSNPENPGKSWKAAIGMKVGTLLKSYSKGKDLENKSGASLYGPGYIIKESNKRFFNGTMLAVTGRLGYGIFSIDAGYQFNGVLKDGVGPSMNKFSLGLTLSGL